MSLKLIKTKRQLEQFFFENTYNDKNERNSISFDKKIIVFEDIDCMSDIVKDRDIKEQEPVVEIKPKKEKKECKNENNNLSYLLNSD